VILVKAWDETFSQTVHQRFSYRYSELIWGWRFTPAFQVDESGTLELQIDQVGAYIKENAQGLPSAPTP
jgi:inward rectifier potassium channel